MNEFGAKMINYHTSIEIIFSVIIFDKESELFFIEFSSSSDNIKALFRNRK